MEQLPTHYGGASMPAGKAFLRGQRQSLNIVAVCQCLFLPWVVFSVVFAVMSFSLHYWQPSLAYFIVACAGLVVLASGVLASSALTKKASSGGREPSWFMFLFFTLLVSYISGILLGDMNYSFNMQPFYDIQNLNTYPNVNPAYLRGQQLMDGGRVFFNKGAKLDLSKSIGFKNLDVYCVAPITSGNDPLSSYDFWAVGVNCCSGTQADFQCGEFNNPRASAGLRLMRDDQRPFFRLAVQQAEAAYQIRAEHPLFFYWMQDPNAEMNSYQDEGYKWYILGIFTHFAVQLFCVTAASVAFSKIGLY